jgi:hypothetical protein
MRVVDVTTGDFRSYPATFAVFPYARYVVENYAKEGLYLGIGYEGPIGGLWLMDPNTGAIRDVANLGNLQFIDGTVAWIGTTNPADPNPAPGGLAAALDSVDRVDVISGSQTPWLYLPGTFVQVVAVDAAGHPIVLIGHGSSNDAELLVLTSPGTAQQIFHGTGFILPGLASSPIVDSHGVWFGSSIGIYLYSPAVGMRKVSDQAGYPGNGCM